MRILSLDVGEVRIGIAVCDALETAAFPVGTLTRVGSLKRDVIATATLIAEQEADAVVLGLPLSLDGEIGSQAQRIQGFGKALQRAISVPLVFWDESLSSVEANDVMIAQGVSRARRRAQIDQMAAALILESYLSQRRQQNAPRDSMAMISSEKP